MTNWTRVLGGGAVGVTVAVAAYVVWSVDGFQDADPNGAPAAALEPAPSPVPVVPDPVASESKPDTSKPAPAVTPVIAEGPKAETEQETPALSAPTFDLVRIEPDGAALVAGQALAGADVTVFLDGDSIAATRVGSDGKFASLMDILPSRQPRVMSLSMRLGAEEVFAATEIIVAPFGTTSPPEQVAASTPDALTLPQDTATAAPVEVAALRSEDADKPAKAPADPAPQNAQATDTPKAPVEPSPVPKEIVAPKDEDSAQADDAPQDIRDSIATTDAPSTISPDVSTADETDGTAAEPVPPRNVKPATETTAKTAPDVPTQRAPSQDAQQGAPNPAATKTEVAVAPPRDQPANGSDNNKPPTSDSASASAPPPNGTASALGAPPANQKAAPIDDPVLSTAENAEIFAPEIANASPPEGPKPAQPSTNIGTDAEAPTPPSASNESVNETPTNTAPAVNAPTPSDTAQTDATPEPPTLLASDQDGVRVLPGPDVLERVAIDTISYDDAGDVALAGRGAGTRDGGFVRVYLDNTPITSSRIRPDGSWTVDLPEVDKGVYTLRVDEVGADGEVKSRAETPFKREDRTLLERVSEGSEGNGPVKIVTVQPGNTLWQIARDRYGEGLLYVRVFKANTSQIRDPDLIYPGQVFDLPDDAASPD